MRPAGLVLLAVLALGACRDQQAPPPAVDRNNPLDIAASEANLIVDPATTSPVGLFERLHSAGSDGLCIAADRAGQLSFGLVMRFGPTLTCEGTGSARHRGATVSLNFSGANCVVDAEYDGQAMRLPGSVPNGCSALCGPRASISGGAMYRVGWTSADALRLRSARHAGDAGIGRTLCASAATP